MLHGDDAKDKNAYPVLAFQSKIRRRKCRLCDIYPAKWVTYNDKLSIENPCFYCDHCYHPFHYSAEGKLLCVDVLPSSLCLTLLVRYNDFTVFPYFHEV
jgi:snRNA-activating protein complex subunit 3